VRGGPEPNWQSAASHANDISPLEAIHERARGLQITKSVERPGEAPLGRRLIAHGSVDAPGTTRFLGQSLTEGWKIIFCCGLDLSQLLRRCPGFGLVGDHGFTRDRLLEGVELISTPIPISTLCFDRQQVVGEDA
jgi:hypothetical protein